MIFWGPDHVVVTLLNHDMCEAKGHSEVVDILAKEALLIDCSFIQQNKSFIHVSACVQRQTPAMRRCKEHGPKL